MSLPEPISERQRRRGREGYIQYLLACLVLGDRPAGWNKPARPSGRGAKLLASIDALAFGPGPADRPQFTWEYLLRERDETKQNAWPDLAAEWPTRMLLFELKTEPGSHREGQVDWYLDLGVHHHGREGRSVDLIYLTRDPVPLGPTDLASNARYANITWAQVNEVLRRWATDTANAEERALAGFLADFVDAELYEGRTVIELEAVPVASPSGAKPKAAPTDAAAIEDDADSIPYGSPQALAEAERIAWEVEETRTQRALNVRVDSWEQVHELKEDVLAALEGNPPPHATPWCWRRESLGRPLSPAGRATGFELRFSWHQ